LTPENRSEGVNPIQDGHQQLRAAQLSALYPQRIDRKTLNIRFFLPELVSGTPEVLLTSARRGNACLVRDKKKACCGWLTPLRIIT
jgi:hypothetical protein